MEDFNKSGMMETSSSTDKDGFKFVKRKSSSNRRNNNPAKFFTHPLNSDESEVHVNTESAISRILTAKDDITSSDFYASASAIIREGLDLIGKPEIEEIVCYGLGHISDSMTSRHQFAFLLSLIDKFKSNLKATYVYDPLFNTTDTEIIQHFNLHLIPNNEEGKRKISKSTLLYFPHCPQLLLNNFLWANWGLNLKNCVLLSNSFSSILESTPKRLVASEAEYIFNISPYVDELYIINTFKFMEIFNNTSLHVFQEDKLCVIDPDFWNHNPEPNYEDTDSDLIRI